MTAAMKAPEIDFKPTPRQREIKAKFLVRVRNSKVYVDNWTRAACEQLLGMDLSHHWSTGFKEWLLDQDEFAAAAELAAYEALQACRDIVLDPGEKGQARVTAAKIIMNIADKEPKRAAQNTSVADEHIAKLASDPAKLKTFLKDSIKKVFSQDELLQLAKTDTQEDNDNGDRGNS